MHRRGSRGAGWRLITWIATAQLTLSHCTPLKDGEDTRDGSGAVAGDAGASGQGWSDADVPDGPTSEDAGPIAPPPDAATEAGASPTDGLDAGHDAALPDTSDPGPWQCSEGQRDCAGTCISAAACCDDDECMVGATCDSGSCRSWCERRIRPAGVAASDYQCLDFRLGLPEPPWTQQVADQGELSASMARALSLPHSMRSHVNAESEYGAAADRGTIEWTAVGATPVESVSVSAAISPVTAPAVVDDNGYVELVCIRNTSTSFCLVHVTQAGYYVGLQIVEQRTRDGWSMNTCDVHASVRTLPVALWTPVELRASSSGSARLWIDGIEAEVSDCSLRLAADTNVTAVVGLHASATTAVAYTAHFDNVVVVVDR